MPRRAVALPVAWAFTLLLSACVTVDGGTTPSGRVGVAYHADLQCDDAIGQVAEVPGGYEVLDGVVGLPTAASAKAALQTSETGGQDAASRLFAKVGLMVRTGEEPFELVVPPEFLDRVALTWGGQGVDTHRLSVPSCEGPSRWLVFAGGVRVADPECVTLELVRGETIEEFTMGVGAPCPGQSSPPYPSST